MTEGRALARYGVDSVGIVLLAAGVFYVEATPQQPLVGVAKIIFPTLLGLLVVGYGTWLRHRGMDADAMGIIAASNVIGGAAFAVFTGWLLFVARLEFVIPSATTFVVLNGVAIGVVLGGIFGTLFVNLRRNQSIIRRRNRELRRQNDRLDQFASIVSHDLRNPLNVAQGRLELARETGEDAHFEAVERSMDRINAILSDMLAFARQGRTVENPEPVSIGTTADAAWAGVETGGIDLVVEGEYEVRAVESRLCQAFENLFRNVREHGGTDVSTVWVGPLEDGTGFYVEDDGRGIPPEDRTQVFESGFSTTVEGTGFGLPIVQAVVQAHDWTIDVATGRDGGARFEIRNREGPFPS